MLVRISSVQNNLAVLMDPLGLFEKLWEPIVVGQGAMATDHGSRRAEWIDDVGSPIGGRSSGLPTKDGSRAQEVHLLTEAEEVVGGTSGSASKVYGGQSKLTKRKRAIYLSDRINQYNDLACIAKDVEKWLMRGAVTHSKLVDEVMKEWYENISGEFFELLIFMKRTALRLQVSYLK